MPQIIPLTATHSSRMLNEREVKTQGDADSKFVGRSLFFAEDPKSIFEMLEFGPRAFVLPKNGCVEGEGLSKHLGSFMVILSDQ